MQKYFFLIFILIQFRGFAQVDSLGNSVSQKDSAIYKNLKTKMTKNHFTNEIYNFLFRDVYVPNEIKKVNDINIFLPYVGKVIGNIRIKTLDIFGPTVYDTLKKGNGFESFASHVIHEDTRKDIIKNTFLLFKEGDKIDPVIIANNERLLRKNPIFHDARIIIEERKGINWLVDVIVIVQDIWSLNFDVTFNNFHNYGLSVDETNFQGLGHSFKNYFLYDKFDPYQKFQFGSRYTIPNLKGTYISTQAEFIWERDLHRQAVRAFRPFITPETKYAGAFEIGYSQRREFRQLIINNIDSAIHYNTKFTYLDTWLGRSFKLSLFNNSNIRVVLAARSSTFKYYDRPEVSADTNKLYWNRVTNLFSLGVSNRNYRRDYLIYGFGRTEDVPVGSMLSLTGGWENTEFGKRGYGGIQFSKGLYLPKSKGYLYGVFNFGSFIKNTILQQGVVSGEAYYFSSLFHINNHQFRHFITLKYTYGINRDAIDYLNISNKEGILGINSEYLRGDKRLTLGLESVMFAPKSFVGFRIASYVFANFGMVNLHSKALIDSPIYQAYGLGFRLRNENLAFNTFQIRISYYPNVPFISSPFGFNVDGVQPLRFRDFDISAPSVVPLQ